MGKHRGPHALAPSGYTGRRRITPPLPEPAPGAVCPACMGTTYNPAGLPCVRCAGTGQPDFRVAQ